MSNTQHDPSAGPGAPGGDWWSRRPHRSAGDRKVAGVAGGLGRAFNVDPVLFRVGFVILTVFGGFGMLLYVLGWLLLPADGDEVSAAESLLGRGRSSTPPALALVLAIVAAFSLASMFSWGQPFWPLVVIGIIAVVVARKKGRSGGRAGRGDPSVGSGSTDWSAHLGQQAASWGAQAEQWVARQPWSGTPGARDDRAADPASPFDKPAFWDDSTRQEEPTGMVNLAKDTPPGSAPQGPPAWDPLGVAPFAWDLPEPAPAPPAPPAPRQRGVVGRLTMGMVLIVGGLATVGILAGWWQLTWAGVSALALAVVAAGLLIGSLRGRGMSLIGPGIFLSVLTLGLTVTGIDGASGYGQQTWAPTAATVQDRYVLNGGQGTLDLRNLQVPAGTTQTIEVEVRAGQASVIVPLDANGTVTCSANVGEVDCLGVTQDGVRPQAVQTLTGSSDEGDIDLHVHVGAGQAEVRHG